VLLKRRYGLSSPLATVAVNENGQQVTVYGGVIFTRAGQADINTLHDIKGKTVATVTTNALSGYQVQAYELSRVGIRMPQGVKLLTTGMPHDKVIEEVLAGHADVGFARTGVLESMAREGRLDFKQLKILNRQNLPGFSQQLSTRLYPEWPFVAMPYIDKNLARHVAAALFMLEEDTAVARAMGIHSFVVPADYSPVENMLREMRLPPFEASPSFTLQDIWARYHWKILGALTLSGLILIMGVCLLLTNRKLAAKQLLLQQQQKKLQESEEKFRTVADYTYGWELWEAPDGSCRYCSPACERVTGYPPEAFMADSGLLASLIHPEDLEQWKAHHAYVHGDAEAPEAGTGKANELEFRILHRDGEVRWIGHLCHHIFDAEGRNLGHRISKRDITERKRAEAKITSLSRILENSLNEIYIFDTESLRFLFVNKGALINLGFTQEEMFLLTPVDIKPEFTLESFLVAVHPLLTGQTEILQFETLHKRKDSTLYNVDIHLQLADYEGKRVFVAITLDITKRKILEAEVVKARNLESLGILAGGIAHDFNNLFQILLGNIQLAKMNTEKASKIFPLLERAEKVSEQAIKLTGKLIAFSPGGLSHPTIIQPASHIREEATATLAGSYLMAEFDLAETLWPITADPFQFRNVIKQMVLNAMEAMPPDSGGKIKIIALNESFLENHGKQPALAPGNYVKISIQDQGSGIKSEHLPRIFDPYFSTKERGSQKGMGLGLALCDAIIRKHGGTITVESKPDEGTTFHIYLPAATVISQ
jgi:PAS domain S-box-containing protein